MSVHYAARYLKTIKRVLFVGGGDSILLHEILLYPGIATVVGLELDQKVVRMAFKYFDKVEWWFGDDTKSLLMLPKEYFGSFDMMLGKWGIGARVPPVGKQPNSNNRILLHPRHNWDLPVIGGPQDIGFDSSLMTIGAGASASAGDGRSEEPWLFRNHL